MQLRLSLVPSLGSGIFLLPSFIAVQLDSLGFVLLVWVVGGLLTIFGALSLAELGSIYSGTGGLCTYLRQVYGPLTAFLYAWAKREFGNYPSAGTVWRP